jgi:hypothetical protein
MFQRMGSPAPLLQTFAEMDLTRDGVINPEEWLAMVHRKPGGHPSVQNWARPTSMPSKQRMCRRVYVVTGGPTWSHPWGR